MEIVESMLMEVPVDGDGHVVADAEDCSESVCTQTHVPVLAHVFEALSLFLHGIVAWTETVDFDLLALDFRCLSLSLALDKRADNTDADPCRDAFQLFCIHL